MADLRDGDAVCLQLRSDPRYLCLVRAMIGSFGALMGFDDAAIHRITLAVDEGCTNIIRHAHGGSSDGGIEVTCRAELLPDGAWKLVVRLVDDGAQNDGRFSPAEGATDPLVPGGLGLALMRDIMDDVRFSVCDDGRNALDLSIRRPDPADRPPSAPSS